MSEMKYRGKGVLDREDKPQSTKVKDVEKQDDAIEKEDKHNESNDSRAGQWKVLQFLSEVKCLVQVYASPRYLILLVFYVIGLFLLAPILFVSHALVLYLQFDARNGPYEVVAQLRLYDGLISFAYMIFPVVDAVIWSVIMPLMSEQHVLIATLITWLDFSLPIICGSLFSELIMGVMAFFVKPEMIVDRLADMAARMVVYMCCLMAMSIKRIEKSSFGGSAESAGYLELYFPEWYTLVFLIQFGVSAVYHFFINKYLRSFLRKILANSVLQYRILHGKYLVFYAKRLESVLLLIVIQAMSLCAHRYYFGWHIIKIITVREQKQLWMMEHYYIKMLILSLVLLAAKFYWLSRVAHTVYNRYESRIIKAGTELYFLGVLGRHTYDIFDLLYNKQAVSPSNSRFARMVSDIAPSMQLHYMAGDDDAEDELGERGEDENNVRKLSIKKRQVYKNKLCLQNDHRHLTLDDLQKASQCFLDARRQLSKKTYTSDIQLTLQPLAENRDGRIKEEELRKLVNGTNESGSADWDSFNGLMTSVDSSKDISLATVMTWMERAHNNCLSLANLLHCSIEAVKYLDRIALGLLIFTCCVVYLAISEVVTAKLGFIIAFPLVPAFILGDICKAMIQGMRFICMMRPFDVGDLCFLDDNLMVVKSFDIWKTTFTKVDDVVATGAEVIYPNSELAVRKITNHKTEFDWKDCLEFNVPSSFHKEEINKLKKQIKDYLDKKEGPVQKKDKREGEYTLDSFSISPLKIAIHFRYNGHSTQDWTYIECWQFKKELKLDFQMHVLDLV